MKTADHQPPNPFRPGAGHMPPYLAGREGEMEEFRRLLAQEIILENMVLTGLRGVGKTVLLEVFRPVAMRERWLWVGTDLSESASISEEVLALRILTDLSLVTSHLVVDTREVMGLGFQAKPTEVPIRLGYDNLQELYRQTPGLTADKLKHVLEYVWLHLKREKTRGLIFAYDEAQNMADHPEKDQFPLALLLDVFQSIQRKNVPFMLALTGLPTLFPKLVEARTFAERMFRVIFLDRLSKAASREAILVPMAKARPLQYSEQWVDEIAKASAGYPYFIQFICREAFDVLLRQAGDTAGLNLPMDEIVRKLDTDFFAGRWARATDRQRDLLTVIAALENSDEEFTVQEIVERSRESLPKPFGASHVNQMLATLSNAGLVYKNRHGRYSFAIPLFGQFILRQQQRARLGD